MATESKIDVLGTATAITSPVTWLLSRPARFLMVGGIAAAVNFFSRILLGQWIPYAPSILFAFLFGITTAFVMNRLFVFNDAKNKLYHQVFWFVTVNLIAVAQTFFVSLILANTIFPRIGFAWHRETIAHGFGVLIPILTSYFGHKHLSFKGSSGV